MTPDSLEQRPPRRRAWTLPLAGLAWLLLILGGGPSLTGCSEFNRAMKASGDTAVAYKMRVAEKYFAKGDYDRSLPLLEELVALTRGTSRSERANYLHAKTIYGMKDYLLGGYYLENFAKTFPTSEYAEECTFLSAMCYYKNSPEYELDQTDTETAIDQFQLFLAYYPYTELKDSCNALIDGLRAKLERKDFENAKQYFRLRNYESASTALKNFVRKWPNSAYREEALFIVLQSDHDLAMNSVESKKEARVAEGIRSFNNFADAFPESKLLNEARRLYDDLTGDQVPNTPKASTP
jgi:outer membrane protein assembly factor BamD